MQLALTGLNKAENIRELAPHLAQAKKMLAAGVKPLALLKAVGLLSPDSAMTGKTPSQNITQTTIQRMANSQDPEVVKSARQKQAMPHRQNPLPCKQPRERVKKSVELHVLNTRYPHKISEPVFGAVCNSAKEKIIGKNGSHIFPQEANPIFRWLNDRI